VYKAGGGTSDITWTAAADGSSGTASTEITFTFSEAVTGLTTGDITIESFGGNSVTITNVTESGPNDGTVWTATLDTLQSGDEGDATITITKTGIETTTTSVVKLWE
jgi:FlaG/FlaF family flagellin (archaellin)